MDNEVIIREWTSDASGDATVDFSGFAGREVNWVKTIPGSGVSSYDLLLNDVDDFDWLTGEGLARSATAPEIIFAELKRVVLPNGDLTFVVSGAGNTVTGTIKVSLKI